VILTQLLAFALASDTTTLAGMGPEASASVPDSVLEFQLPLAGETVAAQGTGILVQAGASARSVKFAWKGAAAGSASGEAQGYGFFAGSTGPLPAGDWILEASALDSAGHEIAHRAVSFRAASSVLAASNGADGGRTRRVQNLHLLFTGGFRAGSSEDPISSTTDLVPGSGGVAGTGDRWEPVDRNAFASGLAQYDFRQGDFRLRARGSSNLAESWGHGSSPSTAGLDLWYGPWAEAHLGDQYPQWTPTLMDGSRIRGMGMGLAATWRGQTFARADVAWGELKPEVDAQAREFVDGTRDTLPAQYRRSIEAFHVAVGLNTPLTLHLAAIHSKDQSNPLQTALQDSLGGATPEENLAVSGDLNLKLWNGIVELYSGSALSLVTEDVRPSQELSSLGSDNGVELPTFLSDLFTFNLSTRGTERFLSNDGDVGGFFSDNLSFRGGARLAVPLGDLGRGKIDARWVHVGPQFETFAKAVPETPRTGVEWNATAALARDQVLVVASGTDVDDHPSVGADVPTSTLNLSCAWIPVVGGPGAHLFSGTLASGGGDQPRLEGWNAGAGFFGNGRAIVGTFAWTADWTINSTRSRSPSADTLPEAASRVLQNDFEATGKWRPEPDLEWRLGYQLGDSRIPLDSLPENQVQDHRVAAGASRWFLRRRLECAADAGISVRAGEPGTDLSGWNQSARVRWEVAQGQVVRLSEIGSRTLARHDLRLEAGWEAWF